MTAPAPGAGAGSNLPKGVVPVAIFAILAIVVAIVTMRDAQRPSTDAAGVTIVAGAPTALVPKPVAAAPAAPTRGISNIAAMRLIELQLLVREKPADAARTAQMRAVLAPRIAALRQGLGLTDVLCADGLCEVTGQLVLQDGLAQDEAVAFLTNGAIRAAAVAAGMRDPTEITINSDGQRTLAFVFHGTTAPAR